MFATQDDVTDLTGYNVDTPVLQQANALVEVYIGRVESRVDDADDLEILRKATAYQAAYISENKRTIFQQMDVSSLTQSDYQVVLRNETSPYIAPLTVLACQRLSWFRGRSISTAPTFMGFKTGTWETDYE